MKMTMKMKNGSHRYDTDLDVDMDANIVNIQSKDILRVTMMMLIFIKHNLGNIWSSIQDKVKQHWGWVEKGVA